MMCFQKIKNLLLRFLRKKEAQRVEYEIPKEPQRIRREKKEQELRYVRTNRGGLNMPKYQPCPKNHGWKKQRHKTLGGAVYWCNLCQDEFFVVYPGGIMVKER